MTDDATVLVVEDEVQLADLYEAFLEPSYAVRTVHDGRAALEAVDDGVDVVLLDRRMPGLSGAEVLEAIRADGHDCRVAMVTAVTPDVDIVEMAFDDYLTKPVDRAALLGTVEELLALSAHDDLVREYYGLAATRGALAEAGADVTLPPADAVDRLTARLGELEAELRERLEPGGDGEVRRLLGLGGPDAG